MRKHRKRKQPMKPRTRTFDPDDEQDKSMDEEKTPIYLGPVNK